MEPWPIGAWVLLLALIADWLTTTESRDFTVKDIIYLHPSSKNTLCFFVSTAENVHFTKQYLGKPGLQKLVYQ